MKKQGIIKIVIGIVVGLIIAFLLRPTGDLLEIPMAQRVFTITFTCIILTALCGGLVQCLLDKKNRKKSEVSKEQINVDIGDSRGITIALMVILGLIIGFVMRPTIPLLEGKLQLGVVISRGMITEGLDMELFSNIAKEAFNVMILWGIIGGISGFFLTLKLKFDYMKFIGKKLRTGISISLKYIIFKQKLVVMMIIVGVVLGVTIKTMDDSMIIFGVMGGILGVVLTIILMKVKRRSLSEKRMKRLAKKRSRFSLFDYLNYRVLWLTIEHSINHREIGDIIGLLGIMFISSIIPCMIILWILGISFTQALGIWMLVTFIYYSVVDSVKKIYGVA